MTLQASSPFLQSSQGTMTGLGVPVVSVYDVTALAAAGPTNITIALPTPCTKIRVRQKSSLVNAATTILRGAVTITDGVNTTRVQPAVTAASAAGQNTDENFDIYTDLQTTSITIPITLAGATTIATMNTEVFGNP
jgi:hypothetical protein